MARITAASPLQRSILQCDEIKLHNWKTRETKKKKTDRGGGDAGVVVRPEARAIGNPIQECHGLAPSSEEVRATHLTTPSTKVKKVKSSQVDRTEQNKSLTVTSRTECCMCMRVRVEPHARATSRSLDCRLRVVPVQFAPVRSPLVSCMFTHAVSEHVVGKALGQSRAQLTYALTGTLIH